MRGLVIAVMAVAVFGVGATAFAADRDRDQLRIRDPAQDQLHLCTPSSTTGDVLQLQNQARQHGRAR